MSNISNFKDAFRGGVRPNQFIVNFFGVQAIASSSIDTTLIAKASSIPASVIGNVDVPYLGRQLKVPGDRTFEDWTITCFADGAWAARSTFERWMQQIQAHRNPVRGVSNPSDVYGNAYVTQLDRSGGSLVTYVMEDIYPTNVAAIDLDWGTNDSVEEFQVTFAINNWYNSSLPEASAGGSGVTADIGVNASISKSGGFSGAVNAVLGTRF
tara:strand:- start:832 stop:1464 length:633 start_codon:yes stop_codon:yes gene_type:complete